MALRRRARHLGIEGEAAGIVDDAGAQLDGLFRDRGFIGIDGDGNRQLAAQPLQHGDQAAQLLGFGDARRTGARGFRADVDDVRAFLFEFDRAGEGAVRIQVLAAVGKRIRGDIQHAHNERALTERQRSIAKFPFEALAGHEVFPA